MLMFTVLFGPAVQLVTPGSLLTQPLAPVGTNTRGVVANEVEQAASAQFNLTTVVPVRLAATGAPAGTVEDVFVILTVIVFVAPAVRVKAEVLIGSEPLA